MNSKLRYLKISKTIGAANAEVDLTTEMDKDYAHCVGFFVTATDLDGLKGSEFSTPFQVADVNVFPKGLDVSLFFVGNEVKADDRFYRFKDKLEANGKKVSGFYKDGGNAGGYPYTLKMFLLLSNEETNQPNT